MNSLLAVFRSAAHGLRLFPTPRTVKLCESPSKAGGLPGLKIIFYKVNRLIARGCKPHRQDGAKIAQNWLLRHDLPSVKETTYRAGKGEFAYISAGIGVCELSREATFLLKKEARQVKKETCSSC
jgi:hypothetical protein